jgi:uncharacterized protein (TIGR03437 family)
LVKPRLGFRGPNNHPAGLTLDQIGKVATTLAGVQVFFSGTPVAFYGEAPGFVSGMMQIDVQIPANASSGSLPLQVSVGRASSQNGVTISVQ